MSARYVLTIPARNDIGEIAFEVDARFGSAVADRVYDSIGKRTRKFARPENLVRAKADDDIAALKAGFLSGTPGCDLASARQIRMRLAHPAVEVGDPGLGLAS